MNVWPGADGLLVLFDAALRQNQCLVLLCPAETTGLYIVWVSQGFGGGAASTECGLF